MGTRVVLCTVEVSARLSYFQLFYAHIPLLGANSSSCSYFDNCTNRAQGMARAARQSAQGNLKQDTVCRDILREIVLSSCLICWDGCVPNKQYVPPPFPILFTLTFQNPSLKAWPSALLWLCPQLIIYRLLHVKSLISFLLTSL